MAALPKPGGILVHRASWSFSGLLAFVEVAVNLRDSTKARRWLKVKTRPVHRES